MSEQLVARPPGRPRSERADKAIIEATLAILDEEASVARVSIEAVAARAGVGKTTIYRRWPNKEALIVDALASLKEPLPEPAGESVRADLISLARSMVPEKGNRSLRCYVSLAGEADKNPELVRLFLRDIIEPRREVFRGVLRRGIASGELRPGIDIEITMLMLVGAITQGGRALDAERLASDFPERVVDTLLHGLT